jgi:calmodulin
MAEKDKFDLFDSDGDGYISSREVAFVLYAAGCNPTVKEAEALAAQANPQDPEHISWTQFQQILGQTARQAGDDSNCRPFHRAAWRALTERLREEHQ